MSAVRRILQHKQAQDKAHLLQSKQQNEESNQIHPNDHLLHRDTSSIIDNANTLKFGDLICFEHQNKTMGHQQIQTTIVIRLIILLLHNEKKQQILFFVAVLRLLSLKQNVSSIYIDAVNVTHRRNIPLF